MPLGNRGWNDKLENYCDGYRIAINGTTATAVNGQDFKQPVVVFGLSLSYNPAIGSGTLTLVDGSATADAGDTRKWEVLVASGNTQPVPYVMQFPRGLAFDVGLIVSAATITGSVSLLYKTRYS